MRLSLLFACLAWAYSGCCCFGGAAQQPTKKEPRRRVAVVSFKSSVPRLVAAHEIKICWNNATFSGRYDTLATLSLSRHIPQSDAIAAFRKQAKALGADALLHFSAEGEQLRCFAVRLLP